jgi:hypothetical protein
LHGLAADVLKGAVGHGHTSWFRPEQLVDQRNRPQVVLQHPPSEGPRGESHPRWTPDAARGRGPWLLAAILALLPTAAASAGPPPPAPIDPPTVAVSSLPPLELRPSAQEPPPTAGLDPGLLDVPNGLFFDSWLDSPHAFIGRHVFGVVNAFDRFFADERDLDCGRAGSFLRWRNELRFDEDGVPEFGTGLRADLKLPYLEKRLKDLRILLENTGQGLVDRQPRAIAGTEDGGRGDAVLRLTLLDTLRSSLDLGGGVLFTLPPGLVGRIRFRQAFGLGRVAMGRFAATGFWNTTDGFGSNATVALERALPARLLLRWTTGALVSQSSSGYEGGSELALLASLGRRTGLTVLGSLSAHSKPEPVIQTWRVAARLRTAFYRAWIYGEVEPEVTWPLDEAGGRRPLPAIVFRLELQFDDAPRVSGVAGARGCGIASKDGPTRGGA